MKIGELARRTGLTVHTLRYYESIDLLPPPLRDAGGQREYDASILDWIAFLGRLKTTGMPIRKMRRYAWLRAEGAGTADTRRALLAAHREKVRAHLAELHACLAVLDAKIASYGDHEEKMDERDHIEPGEPVRARPRRAGGD